MKLTLTLSRNITVFANSPFKLTEFKIPGKRSDTCNPSWTNSNFAPGANFCHSGSGGGRVVECESSCKGGETAEFLADRDRRHN